MKKYLLLFIGLLAGFWSYGSQDVTLNRQGTGLQKPKSEAEGFSFCRNGKVDIAILLDPSASSVVKYAVKDVAKDFKESTSVMPSVVNKLPESSVVILPVDLSSANSFLSSVEEKTSVDLSSLKGKWESFKIIPIKDGFKKGQNVLLVAGSDPRGTMYGLYEVSERVLGTDPQKLWTDARPVKVTHPEWNLGIVEKGEPTFKYRGWFINDENYLLSWRGPDKDDMRIEPDLWADIFETICRMRGNFYTITEYGWSPDSTTLKLANDRGLYVMGSHMHMLIANTSFEWWPFVEKKYGKDVPYDWSTSRDEMISFWEDAVKKYKDYRAIWPIGLKSWNDRDFCETDPGAPKTVEGRTVFTNDAIREQKNLLNKYLDPDKGKPICSFVMRYDPVQQFHTGKLKFPENTIILWPDNPSFGLMGEVPAKEDFEKVPLHGIFFHLTYCDNQYVQWTPLKQVQHELMKAVDAHATTMAEFNVGDVRELPLKIAMAMNFTNDAKPWKDNPDYWRTFTESWCRKEYNPLNVEKIADLYEKYWKAEMPCRCGIVVESISHYTVMPGNILDSIKGKQEVKKAILDYVKRVNIPTGDRFGRLSLPYLNQTAASWDSLYTQVKEASSLVSRPRRQFYFDSFTLQVQTSRLINHWGMNLLSAFDAIRKNDFKSAAVYLEAAAKWLRTIEPDRDKAQHDKWKNWFRGEENRSWVNSWWGFHIEREINADLQFAQILRTLK